MSEPRDSGRADRFEAALRAAMERKTEAVRVFFEMLLQQTLYVPERFQALPLSDAPKYPNAFINILGVRDGERAVVPVFSRPEYIAEWCGSPLTRKELPFEKLLTLVPEGWWLTVNPGREAEKELSPWELVQLRAGPAGMEALLEEICAPEMTETLDVRPVAEEERPALCAALRRAAAEHPAVTAVRLLREEGRDADGKPLSRILIGVEARGAGADELDALRSKILDAVRLCQIGDEPIKLLVSDNVLNSLSIGMFRDAPPLYRRKIRWRDRPLVRRILALMGA